MEEKDSAKLAEMDVAAVDRGGFPKFIEIVWPRIEAAAFRPGPHITLMAQHCEALLNLEALDMVINVPPGTSKSRVCSILFPCYGWIRDPSLKWMKTSYDQTLTTMFALKIKNLICTEWWQRRWPQVAIVDGLASNTTLFDTTAGGTHISTMMGGAATGKHCDILIGDDPHKPDDLARGDADTLRAVVDLAWTRWIDTFSTRRADAATFRRLVVMQRLHEEDLSGRMLQRPKTVHLCLPMEYEPERHCSTPFGEDWRTEKGELLSPNRYPQDIIEEARATMTPRSFAAQHQQRPAAEEGNLIKRAYFANRWTFLPPGTTLYMSVDANLKERRDTDEAVIQTWGIYKQNYYLVDQLSGRWSVTDIMNHIRGMRDKWPGIRNTLIEAKANGPAIISLLRQEIPGVLEIEPQGGKKARLEAVEWIIRAAQVLVPTHSAPWVEQYIHQMITFPASSADDMVDACTQFLIWAMTNGQGLSAWLRLMQRARHTGRMIR